MVLVRSGRWEEAVARLPRDSRWRMDALLRLGRLDEVIAAGKDYAGVALAERGHYGDSFAKAAGDIGSLQEIALMLRIAGAGDNARELLDLLARNPAGIANEGLAFGHHLLPPILAALDGREADFHSGMRRVIDGYRWTIAQTVWHDAAFIAGEIDEDAYRAQPYRRCMPARLALVQAIRADCRGEHEAALAAYRRYHATPLYQRMGSRCTDRFAAWRAKVLAGGGE
jgi:hypothetical protein